MDGFHWSNISGKRMEINDFEVACNLVAAPEQPKQEAMF